MTHIDRLIINNVWQNIFTKQVFSYHKRSNITTIDSMATWKATSVRWKHPEPINRHYHAHDAYITAVWKGILDWNKYKSTEETCLCLYKVKDA